MSRTNKPRLPNVIWIGDRSEGNETTDFDGRLRRGVVLGKLQRHDTADGLEPGNHVWIKLKPPLSVNGSAVDEVVIHERRQEGSLLALGKGWIPVDLYGIGSRSDAERGIFEPTKSSSLGVADVALDPAFLPPTQEELWDRSFNALARFVEREGHARVSPNYEDGGLSVGTWVQNQKFFQFEGHLRPDWSTRLEALPGWHWFESDEFSLLELYARREGHTDVPREHYEGDRPLGGWLAGMRSMRSLLPPDWVTRLEAIPYWHW